MRCFEVCNSVVANTNICSVARSKELDILHLHDVGHAQFCVVMDIIHVITVIILAVLYLHFDLGWLGESDLELVVEELRGVVEKWRLIGRELGLLGVDDIRYPDSTDCLREVVRRRLQLIGTNWRTIIVALRIAGEPHLADNLKAKYLPGELTTTTSSQYSLESQHEECILLYCD